MDREIKFRGKRIDNGEWVYGHCFEMPNEFEDEGGYQKPVGLGCYIADVGVLGRYHREVDPKTVGQYTGLKDKNKKEIYENDKVKVKYSNNGEGEEDEVKVTFSKEGQGWYPFAWEYSCDGCDCGLEILSVEVIDE